MLVAGGRWRKVQVKKEGEDDDDDGGNEEKN